jgi:hypothetical protein
MGTAKLQDEKISQYFDGELPEDEASEVRALLERDVASKQKLEGLAHLRGLIRLAAEDMAADVDSDELFSQITSGVERDQKEGGRGLTAIEGGKRIRGGVEGWRIAVPITVGLAAAAAILFVIWAQGEGREDYTDRRGLGHEQEGIVEIHHDESSFLLVEAPQGTEVEEVDFGDNTGTVFAVEGEAGEPIAVVWIDDVPEEAMQ